MDSKELKLLAITIFNLHYGRKPLQVKKVRNKLAYTVTAINQLNNRPFTQIVNYVEKYNTIVLRRIGGFEWVEKIIEVKELQDYARKETTKEEYDKRYERKYTLDQIIDGLEDGSFNIDTKGHNISLKGDNNWFIEHIKKRVIEIKTDAIERSTVKGWVESIKKNSKKDENRSEEEILQSATRLAEEYQRTLSKKFRNNYNLGGFDSPEVHCHSCGQRHKLHLIDKTITLAPSYTEKQKGNLDVTCQFANGLKPKVVELNMPSGNIVFQNYFMVKNQKRNDDTVYDPKEDYYDQYSVGDHRGRINLMKKLSEKGVGYGQMGNMSIGIYVNPNKNRIIIGDNYCEDYEYIDPDYTKAMEEGFMLVGEISLSVWAYYCVDQENMIKYNTDDPDDSFKTFESKDIKEDNHNYAERIITNVKKGTWRLTHYYDNTPDPENGRLFKYAELELI